MGFLAQNIGFKGRIVRGLGSVALAAGGLILWQSHPIVASLLWISAAFILFEALKGWCALRACGIKTKF